MKFSLFEKTADWLAFHPKSGTADEWTQWEREYKTEAPIRYLISHQIPHYFYPVKYSFITTKDWIRYRVVKYHILDTKLPPDWYDKDTLILHVNFNLLKDFVECELASMQDRLNPAPSWKHRIPFYTSLFWRNAEQGLQHLNWSSSLDNPTSAHYDKQAYEGRTEKEGVFTQASGAREIKALYHWWAEVRPNRIEEPYPEHHPHPNESALYSMSDEYKTEYPSEHKATQEWFEKHQKQEEDWYQEDQEMLIRLIKLRCHLWT